MNGEEDGGRCGRTRGRILPAIVIAAAILIYFVEAAVTFQRPLGGDEANYAVVAQEVLSGGKLYVDALGLRPPLTYGAYAAAFSLFGQSETAIRLFALIVHAASLGLLILLAYRVAGKRAAYVTLLLGALWWGSPGLEGRSANTELFSNLLVIASACLFMSYLDRPAWRSLLAAAFLVGLATLVKQVAVATAGAIWLAMLSSALSRKEEMRRFVKATALLAAGVAIPWLAVLGWFGATGRLREFMAYNFQWVAGYDAVTVSGRPFLTRLSEATSEWRPEQAGLWLAALAGIFCVRPGRSRGKHAFLVAWPTLNLLVILRVGRFHEHHFLVMLPGIVILTALALMALWEEIRSEPAGWRRPAVILAIVFLLASLRTFAATEASLYRQIINGQMTAPGEGLSYEQARDVGLRLRKISRAGDTLLVWGQAPQLYFYSGLKPACPMIAFDTWLSFEWRTGYRSAWAEREARMLKEAVDQGPTVIVITEFADQAREYLGGMADKRYTVVSQTNGITVLRRSPLIR
jgi:4-amino-4-deoxy-L-arabinose transferase-like glycosyltransferase